MRISDVVQILSNKQDIHSPYYIKPDRSPEIRAQEALLLKERYTLLQSGLDKSDIKIRNFGIYVKGILYGQASSSGFPRVRSDTGVLTNASPDLSEGSHSSPDSSPPSTNHSLPN